MFWDTPAEWREAQSNLGVHLNIHFDHSKKLIELADCISHNIEALNVALDALCTRTCPSCLEPCCVLATVRYDFRDLLFLHLIQKGLPMGQPAPWDGKGCSCLWEKGCMIERLMRPFMCTWYLCPAQKELLRSEKWWRKYRLPQRLREIQDDRKKLENAFLKLVAPVNISF